MLALILMLMDGWNIPLPSHVRAHITLATGGPIHPLFPFLAVSDNTEMSSLL